MIQHLWHGRESTAFQQATGIDPLLVLATRYQAQVWISSSERHEKQPIRTFCGVLATLEDADEGRS